MGAIASIVYSFRNYGKAGKGDIGRAPVAVMQTINAVNNSTESGMSFIADKAKYVVDKTDELGKMAGITNGASKVAKFAAKAVNPLLVGAAGIRVLRDDDKKSALVEEVVSMGTMFGSEKVYKTFKNTVEQSMGKALKDGSKTFKSAKVQNIAGSIGKKISGLSSGKQKLVFILADLALVGVSIISYNLAKKLGKKITGRDKTEKTDKPKEQTVKVQNVKNQAVEEQPALIQTAKIKTSNPFDVNNSERYNIELADA